MRMPISFRAEESVIFYAVKNLNFTVFTGVDNAFNAKYSLGNDINAAGGRYYNAAATANYFVGLIINFQQRK